MPEVQHSIEPDQLHQRAVEGDVKDLLGEDTTGEQFLDRLEKHRRLADQPRPAELDGASGWGNGQPLQQLRKHGPPLLREVRDLPAVPPWVVLAKNREELVPGRDHGQIMPKSDRRASVLSLSLTSRLIAAPTGFFFDVVGGLRGTPRTAIRSARRV